MKRQKPKKTAPKFDKKLAQDLSRYTLPSVDESISPEVTSAPFTVNPEPAESSKETAFWSTKTGKLWVIGFFCLILVAVASFLFIFRLGMQDEVQPKAVLQASPSPTALPTPSPSEVDKSAYKIQVLNGSGIKGEAAAVKASLDEEGFVVSAIGNADKSDYEESTISIKKGVEKEFVLEVKEALGSYTFSEQETELSKSSDVDMVVIIGSKQ